MVKGSAQAMASARTSPPTPRYPPARVASRPPAACATRAFAAVAAAPPSYSMTASWLHPADDGPAEQAARPDEEDDDDHGQGHGQLQLGADEGHVGPYQVLGDAHMQQTHHRARRAREPSHRRRREGVDLDAAHHVRIEEDDGRDHHAGHRPEG